MAQLLVIYESRPLPLDGFKLLSLRTVAHQAQYWVYVRGHAGVGLFNPTIEVFERAGIVTMGDVLTRSRSDLITILMMRMPAYARGILDVDVDTALKTIMRMVGLPADW